MGDEIDDIEFARQMLSLQVNKYEENRNRGMKQKQVVDKSHNIIPLSDFEEKIIFNIVVKIQSSECHARLQNMERNFLHNLFHWAKFQGIEIRVTNTVGIPGIRKRNWLRLEKILNVNGVILD